MDTTIQDSHFDLPAFSGKSIEQFLVYSEAGSSNAVQIIVLKLRENNSWYRFCLDAGIGFYSKRSSKKSATEGFEACLEIDYATKWQLVGSIILAVRCVGTKPDQPEFSKFVFLIDRLEIKLTYSDPTNVESETHLIRHYLL